MASGPDPSAQPAGAGRRPGRSRGPATARSAWRRSWTAFPPGRCISVTAASLADRSLGFSGPLGRRTVSRCIGGAFSGDRLSGRVAEDPGNEWRLVPDAGEGFQVEGLLSLVSDDGKAILARYVGRGGRDTATDGIASACCSRRPLSVWAG